MEDANTKPSHSDVRQLECRYLKVMIRTLLVIAFLSLTACATRQRVIGGVLPRDQKHLTISTDYCTVKFICPEGWRIAQVPYGTNHVYVLSRSGGWDEPHLDISCDPVQPAERNQSIETLHHQRLQNYHADVFTGAVCQSYEFIQTLGVPNAIYHYRQVDGSQLLCIVPTETAILSVSSSYADEDAILKTKEDLIKLIKSVSISPKSSAGATTPRIKRAGILPV